MYVLVHNDPTIAQLYFQNLAKPTDMLNTTEEVATYIVDSNYVNDRWLHKQLSYILTE